MQTLPEKRADTGYTMLRVKKATKDRLAQIMQATSARTEDDSIALLIEHYTKTTDQHQRTE
jgi:hypothetical protein